MPTAMVTFNGRITLPPQVRKDLGLDIGDSVDFIEIEKGKFAICNPSESSPSESSLSESEKLDFVAATSARLKEQ